MKYQKKHYSIKAVLTRNLSILIATSLISLFFSVFFPIVQEYSK